MVENGQLHFSGGIMPRLARLDAPGTLHHVMIRGIEKGPIVDDHQDRRNWIDRLGIVAQETETRILAWSLLDNHAHILLKSGPNGISQFMRRFLTGYAVAYNLRHGRHGHLFQNRYKSIVCDEDVYFQELVRYIHLNPFRAGLVKDIRNLERYPWCGHGAVMGKVSYPWQDRGYVLSWFGKRKKQALMAYRRYVAEGVSLGHRPELVGGGLVRSLGGWSAVMGRNRTGDLPLADARILGVDDFVERVLKEAEPRVRHSFPPIRVRDRVREVIEKSCLEKGIHRVELAGGNRRGRVSRLRVELAHRLLQEFGLPLAEIARQLGVSTSAISKMFTRSRHANST
jgi:REP element-mobilizing transposase RayT